MLFTSLHYRSEFRITSPSRVATVSLLALLAFGLALRAGAQQPTAQDSQAPPAAQQPANQNPPQDSAPATAPQPGTQESAPPPTPAPPQQPATQDSQAPASNAAPQPAQEPAPAPAAPAQSQTSPAGESVQPQAIQEPGITEDEVKQLLLGKALYLRGGYLDDSLSFNEHGKLIGHSPEGSYTLCGVQIDKVKLTKHKVELEGARYGLHFLGALPYEDPTTAVNRVRITPKKKMLKITIDREVVVKPKKQKEQKRTAAKGAPPKPASGQAPAAQSNPSAPPETADASAPPAPGAAAPAPAVSSSAQTEPTEADELKSEISAAPPEERPADPSSVTTTTSPAHAAKVLKDALDAVFAAGLDDRMMAAMPDFWKLYYQAAAAKTDFRLNDPSVLRQNTVDTKAKLLTTFEPPSNEYAQANGVAGMSLYHAVIGVDGKPEEIAVARPIGFGLDENAVNAIRAAKFEPAMKDGKPVSVLLDLIVQFRIYSKRTAVKGNPEEPGKPPEPSLPGPYSIEHPAQPQAQ